MHPLSGGGGAGLNGVRSLEDGHKRDKTWQNTKKQKKNMGWVRLRGLSAFLGSWYSEKYCVAHRHRIFLHWRSYPPWWSVCVFVFFFLPIISIVKQHLCTGLSPQNIRHVPCLFTSISVLWPYRGALTAPRRCLAFRATHPILTEMWLLL